MGLDSDVDGLGRGESRVRFVLPSPSGWLDGGTAWLGLPLLVAGLAAWGLAVWRPASARFLVLAKYPLFTLAGWLLLAAAVPARWSTDGWVWDVGGGVDVRFIATTRTGAVNFLTVWGCVTLGLVCHVLAYGRLRREVPAAAIVAPPPPAEAPVRFEKTSPAQRSRTTVPTPAKRAAAPRRTQAKGSASQGRSRPGKVSAEGGTAPS